MLLILGHATILGHMQFYKSRITLDNENQQMVTLLAYITMFMHNRWLLN